MTTVDSAQDESLRASILAVAAAVDAELSGDTDIATLFESLLIAVSRIESALTFLGVDVHDFEPFNTQEI